MKRFFRVFTLVFVMFLTTAGLFAQSRGGDHEGASGSNGTEARQWVVRLILEKYKEKGWENPPLKRPVKDGQAIQEVLRDHYIIHEWRELKDQNASKQMITQLFKDLSKEVGENDSVFVFHAGHGARDSEGNTYWIPYDAGFNPNMRSGWIRHDEIWNYLDALPAKHVFLISDSCYSGGLLDAKTKRGVPETVTQYPPAYAKKSRQVLVSGAIELVDDDSEFASRLIDILKSPETLKRPYITPDYLFYQIVEAPAARKLLTQPNLGQMPQSRHEVGGSFLFFRKGTEILPLPVDNSKRSDKATDSAGRASFTSLRDAAISFAGDSLSERDRHTVITGLRNAMQTHKVVLDLDENSAAGGGYGFNVTVYREQRSGMSPANMRSEVTVAFSRNGWVLCQAGPYYITESDEAMTARRIAERLRSDKAFFNRVNEAIGNK